MPTRPQPRRIDHRVGRTVTGLIVLLLVAALAAPAAGSAENTTAAADRPQVGTVVLDWSAYNAAQDTNSAASFGQVATGRLEGSGRIETAIRDRGTVLSRRIRHGLSGPGR